MKTTIEANKKVVNYLDTTLDLNQLSYRPFKKPNDTPIYVNAKSNHPPSVLRNIPKGINRRISDLSATKEIFEEAAQEYQNALKTCGYKYNLEFMHPSDTDDPSSTKPNSNESKGQKNRNKRRRNIIWYNPPFDGTVATNVGKEFLKTLDESFPAGHKLHKIFNRSTVKLSYSCMPNLSQIINSTNRRKLHQNTNTEKQTCNCRRKDECPLQQKCLTSAIIYQATVTAEENKKETYVGMTETTFKTRYANHKLSFKHEKYKNQTELSKHIWSLKEQKIKHTISWNILQHAKPYEPGHKSCNLCTAEKFFIMCKPEQATLNTRAELIGTCRHRKKHLLTHTI